METFTMPKTAMYWMARVRIGIFFTKMFFGIDTTSTHKKTDHETVEFLSQNFQDRNYIFFFYISALVRLSQISQNV